MQKAAQTMRVSGWEQNVRQGHRPAICATFPDFRATIRARFTVILKHLGRRGAFVALQVTAIALLVTFSPAAARAQFIGFTSPQTVQQTLATNVACTGAAQTFDPMNLGQNQHFATASISSATTQFRMIIIGVDGTNSNQISDTMFLSSGAVGTIYGTGYFPIIRVSITCTGGMFSLSYSGTSANTPIISGGYLSTEQSKLLFSLAAANAAQSISTFLPPFGNASGLLRFRYNTAGVNGSTLGVRCLSTGMSTLGYFTQDFPIANTLNPQFFKVPTANCPLMQIGYTSGGATAGTITLDYIFDLPGTGLPETANYVYISGTTATAAKPTAGVLTTLIIGTPDAGTVTVHDLPAASCVMVPATNIVAKFTEQAMGTPQTHTFNHFFTQGICVKASVAMDVTVGVQ